MKKKILTFAFIIYGSIGLISAENLIQDPTFENLSTKKASGQWKKWGQDNCLVESCNGQAFLTNNAKNRMSSLVQNISGLESGKNYAFEVECKSGASNCWGKVAIEIVRDGRLFKLVESKPFANHEFSKIKLNFRMPEDADAIRISLLRSSWNGALGPIIFRNPALKISGLKKKEDFINESGRNTSSIQPVNSEFTNRGKDWLCDWGYGMNRLDFIASGNRLSVACFKYSGANWMYLMPVLANNPVFTFESGKKYIFRFLAQWQKGDNKLVMGFRKADISSKRFLSSGKGKKLLDPVFSVHIPKDLQWHMVEVVMKAPSINEKTEYLLPCIGCEKGEPPKIICIDSLSITEAGAVSMPGDVKITNYEPVQEVNAHGADKLKAEILDAENLAEKFARKLDEADKSGYDVCRPRVIQAVINYAGIAKKDLPLFLNKDEQSPSGIILLKQKLSYIKNAVARGMKEVKQIIAADKRKTPSPSNMDLCVKNGYFSQNNLPVLLIGPQGDHLEVEDDLAFIRQLGCNSVMAEAGPSNMFLPGFEDRLKHFMESARKNNLSVTFQLAGHFFPLDLIGRCPEARRKVYYNMYWGFFMMSNKQKLCIENPEVRKILKDFYRKTAKTLKDSPALNSYTIWNEPYYMCYCDKSIQMFQKRLSEKYSSIEKLNEKWKTSLAGFKEARPPKLLKVSGRYKIDPENLQAWRDWLEFNNRRMVDFFAWLKETIREVDKKTPIHIKKGAWHFCAYGPIAGIDSEALNEEVEDVAGFDDACPYTPFSELQTDRSTGALVVDFMRSVSCGKPIYDTEFHAVGQKKANGKRAAKSPDFIRSILLEHFIHGVSGISYFVWRKQEYYHSLNDLNATPYETLETFGRTCLEIKKLAPLITRFNRGKPDSAILYSKSTFLNTPVKLLQSGFWETPHLETIKKTAQAFYNINLPVRFVTERQLKAGKTEGLKLIIIPSVAYIENGAAAALLRFAENGGTVIFTSGSFIGNEYQTPNDWIKKFGFTALKRDSGKYVVDASKSKEIGELIAHSLETVRCRKAGEKFNFNGNSYKTIGGGDVISGGEKLAAFESGSPAIAVSRIGRGRAIYIAAELGAKKYAEVLDALLEKLNLHPEFYARSTNGDIVWGVELQSADVEDGKLVYLANFNSQPQYVKLHMPKPPSSVIDIFTDAHLPVDIIKLDSLKPLLLKIKF